MPCKGTCFKIKVTGGKGEKYSQGLKRCSECKIWTPCPEIHCPCCGTQFRNRPQASKQRKKFHEAMGVIYAE